MRLRATDGIASERQVESRWLGRSSPLTTGPANRSAGPCPGHYGRQGPNSSALLAATAPLLLLTTALLQAAAPVGPSQSEPIEIAADSIRNWTEGNVRILLLKGHVYVAQGLFRLRAPRAVIWLHEPTGTQRGSLATIELYAEGGVSIETLADRRHQQRLFQTFQTYGEVRVELRERLVGPAIDDPLYLRGVQTRSGGRAATLQAAQTAAGNSGDTAMTANFQLTAPPILPQELQGRLTLNPRGFTPFQVETVRLSPTEQALVFTGGINAVLQEPGDEPIDILADRMVLWTRPLSDLAAQQGQQPPLQLYLEGNVIFRQGDRTAEMNQLYYDADRHAGIATDATLYAYHEKLQGPVFVRARRLRQLAENIFLGHYTQITPSRFPLPTYALEADRVFVEEEVVPLTSKLTGQPAVDPATGKPIMTKRRWVTSEANVLRFMDLPIFYWPYLQGPLDQVSTPLRRVRLRQSRSFGTELQTNWDMFRLLGRQQPDWIDHWDLLAGYLSRRGPAIGTDLEYAGPRTLWPAQCLVDSRPGH